MTLYRINIDGERVPLSEEEIAEYNALVEAMNTANERGEDNADAE